MGRVGMATVAVCLLWMCCSGLAIAQGTQASGITFQALSDAELSAIEQGLGRRVGVRVTLVATGSPAEAADVKCGDILLTVNDHGVASPTEAAQALTGQAGRVKLVVARASGANELSTKTLWLEIGAGAAAPVSGGVTPATSPNLLQALGLTVQQLDADDLASIAAATGKRAGVFVVAVAPGSRAAAAGIRDDDILFDVGGQTIDGVPSLVQALSVAPARASCQVWRAAANGGFQTVPASLDLQGLATGQATSTGPAPTPVASTLGAAASADLQNKLNALEAARQAGILTNDEYARKRAEIEAQIRALSPQPDPATQQKLQALDAARAAGVITEAEYAQKRAQLLGQGAVATGVPPATTTGTTPPVATVPATWKTAQSPALGGFSMKHPPEWTATTATSGPALSLSNGSRTVEVLPAPNVTSLQQVYNNVLGQMRGQTGNYTELASGKGRIAGQEALLCDFTGTNPEGKPVVTRLAGVLNGTNAFLIIMGAPSTEVGTIRPLWDMMLSTFTFGTATATPRTWY
ncbi:PDZ domain-containing protein [bacterium]|nr:PDZ domain-containing protein [bacterium]